eukprot:SAG31_NODE_743_length_12418_cov_3.780908_13_plen_138_part_00
MPPRVPMKFIKLFFAIAMIHQSVTLATGTPTENLHDGMQAAVDELLQADFQRSSLIQNGKNLGTPVLEELHRSNSARTHRSSSSSVIAEAAVGTASQLREEHRKRVQANDQVHQKLVDDLSSRCVHEACLVRFSANA